MMPDPQPEGDEREQELSEWELWELEQGNDDDDK